MSVYVCVCVCERERERETSVNVYTINIKLYLSIYLSMNTTFRVQILDKISFPITLIYLKKYETNE